MWDRRLFIGSLVAWGALGSAGASAVESAPDAIVLLAEHVLGTRYEDIPEAALATTRAQLLDMAGVALAGRNEAGVRELRELSRSVGGNGESVVWGSSLRLPSHDAARLNAVMVDALEFDDTFGPGFLHPSAITFPVALAVADMVGNITGREFLAATSLATDVACRLALAGEPGVDGFSTGWHNTTLIGYLSTALVAGRLMKLDRDQLVNAAGIACHQAAGNAQSHIDGALTKRMGPGFASAAGLMAARLAARGLAGPRGVLEGQKGWFRQYHKGNYSRDLLLGGLGTSFPGAAMSFKPWPSCRGSHTAADAALQLISENRLQPGQIERILVHNGPAEWPFLSNPIESKRNPKTTVEAQFSIPWVVAAAFTDAKVRIAHFTPEALARADIHAMAERVSALQDDSLANPQGGPGQAVVEVTTRDGRKLRCHVVAAKGDPQAPMSPDEVSKKFEDCLEYAGFKPARGQHLRRLIDNVAGLGDISRLSRLMG